MDTSVFHYLLPIVQIHKKSVTMILLTFISCHVLTTENQDGRIRNFSLGRPSMSRSFCHYKCPTVQRVYLLPSYQLLELIS